MVHGVLFARVGEEIGRPVRLERVMEAEEVAELVREDVGVALERVARGASGEALAA